MQRGQGVAALLRAQLAMKQEQLSALSPAGEGLGHDPLSAVLIFCQLAHQLQELLTGGQPPELMGAAHQFRGLRRPDRSLEAAAMWWHSTTITCL